MTESLLRLGMPFLLVFFSVCQSPRQAIWKSDHYALYRDSLVQAPFVARALSANELVSDYRSLSPLPGSGSRRKVPAPSPDFPRYQSDYPLVDALYNLALEEMGQAVAADSTFHAGQQGAQHLPYSIWLAMAALQPRVSANSLLRQVEQGRLRQPAGTYPLAAGRMVWALAAWELYRVTGQDSWLRQAYPIIKNALEEDLRLVYNPRSGLFRGTPSLAEGREQRYPAWMQPVDLYESESLSVNAVYYQVLELASDMATRLHDMEAASKYHQLAVGVRKRINDQLWLPEKGYYGQYRYGRHFKVLSPRSDGLAQAQAILFGITDIARQESLLEKVPVTAWGIAGIYPPLVPPDPSQAWPAGPLVQACWALAAAKAGEGQALVESMGALYRPAALLLTHRQSSGTPAGRQATLPGVDGRDLVSLAGNLSLVLKVIFGLDFQPQSLAFKPVVPRAFGGRRQLSNFRYRQAILDIDMTGYGNQIRTFRLDGEKLPVAAVPAGLTGRHRVSIELANKELPQDKKPGRGNQVSKALPPAVPVLRYDAGMLSWEAVAGAVAYRVLKNGALLLRTTSLQVPAREQAYAEYQVIAVDARGLESFAAEPVEVVPAGSRQRYELESQAAPADQAFQGFSGTGFVASDKGQHSRLRLPVTVPQTGWYAIDFRYALAGGPDPAAASCALRSLSEGDALLGTIVLPRRGGEAGAGWGFSNAVQVKLQQGSHTLLLALAPAQGSGPGQTEQVLLDYMRLTLIKAEAGN